MSHTHTVGVIGLGKMGAPIARRLHERGFELVVHDTNDAMLATFSALGVSTRSTPRGVADSVETVITCLPTPEIVREVILGSSGVWRGERVKTVIDISTTGPQVVREIAAELAKVGKSCVDAPVTGGVAGAKSGTLTVILGASAAAIEAVRPVLLSIGSNLVIAGSRPGDGQLLKVINNLLSFIALEATAEAMALGVKAGLDPEVMLRTFNAGTGRNSATEEKFPRSVMPRSFDFGFPVRGVMKDTGLCLAEAEAMGVPMPVSTASRQVWAMAMAERGDEDMTSIVKLFEKWADVEIRSAPIAMQAAS